MTIPERRLELCKRLDALAKTKPYDLAVQQPLWRELAHLAGLERPVTQPALEFA